MQRRKFMRLAGVTMGTGAGWPATSRSGHEGFLRIDVRRVFWFCVAIRFKISANCRHQPAKISPTLAFRILA